MKMVLQLFSLFSSKCQNIDIGCCFCFIYLLITFNCCQHALSPFTGDSIKWQLIWLKLVSTLNQRQFLQMLDENLKMATFLVIKFIFLVINVQQSIQVNIVNLNLSISRATLKSFKLGHTCCTLLMTFVLSNVRSFALILSIH